MPLFCTWGYFMTIQQKATERDRTADLLITNQLLYRLSYGGLYDAFSILSDD